MSRPLTNPETEMSDPRTAPTTLPHIEVGFCTDEDHLTIGIGGNRVLIYNFREKGIYINLELWQSEASILWAVDLASRCEAHSGEGIVRTVVSSDDLLRKQLAESPDFLQRIKDVIIERVREFRKDPHVQERTRYWKRRRLPSPILTPSAGDVAQYGRPEHSDQYDPLAIDVFLDLLGL